MPKTMRVRSTITAILAGLSLSAHAIADTQRIDIPAGSLLSALEILAQQANVDLVYQGAQVNGLRTGGVAGELSPRDAVVKLLQGTPLQVRTDESSGAILITAPVAGHPTASRSPNGMEEKAFWSRLHLAQIEAPSSSQAQGQVENRQQPAGAQNVEEPAEPEVKVELEEILVSGTHIRGASPTAAVRTITRQDIEQQGFVSAEDVVRSLTFNRGNQGSQQRSSVSNESFNGNTHAGLSAPDLRGLGMGTTLVLINGRRVPMSAMTNGETVDLSTIPLAAVERVEVVLDGASSIYGSDAVGGVINFILRQDYTGAQMRARYSDSNTGGDARDFEGTVGFGWGSGSVVTSAAVGTEEPVRVSRLIRTQDFRSRGGRDFRSTATGPVGTFFLVDPDQAESVGLPAGTTAVTFPAGQPPTLANAIVSFDPLGADLPRLDRVLPPDLTAESRNRSLSVSARQELSPRMTLDGTAFYSRRQATMRSTAYVFSPSSVNSFVPAPGSLLAPLDPDAHPVEYLVNYSSTVDAAAGDAGAYSTSRNVSELVQASVGLVTQLAAHWDLTANVDYARDENEATERFLDFATASFAPLPASFNPFSSGGQSQAFYDEAFLLRTIDTKSTSRAGTLRVNGQAFRIPGGPVKLAAGIEYRHEKFSGERKSRAGFLELNVPIVGEDNARPGIQSLVVSAAGRYDSYDQIGTPSITDDNTGETTDLDPISVDNDAFSPAFGLRWGLAEDLTLRYHRSRSYNLPSPAAMFTSNFSGLRLVTNPDDPDGPLIPVIITNGGNPGLTEQIGTTWSLGAEWTPFFAPNWGLSVAYHDINIEDYIASLLDFGDLSYLLTEEGQNIRPGAVVVVPGSPTTMDLRSLNFARFRSKSVDFIINHDRSFARGELSSELAATYAKDNELFTGNGSTGNRAGTIRGPSKWTARARSSWAAPRWSATAVLNYEDGYDDDTPNVLRREVSSFTTVDLQVAWKLDNLMKGLQVAAGGMNVFDADFPFVDREYGFEGTRVDFRKRRLYLEIKADF